MKIISILILFLVLFRIDSFGHDQIVHEGITFNAAESAYDESPAYSNFVNVISLDLSYTGPFGVTNSMIEGSSHEDDKLKEDLIGGNRSLNHFYDPIRKIGLSDRGWPLSTNLLGRDSFTWGSVSNGPGVDQSWPINKYGTSNTWSWPNARGYEWLGLTAANRSDRQTNLLNMFRAVGQVMHLLQDNSQPQHVRDEQHLDQVFNMDLRSRSAIEDYGFNHSTNLNYAHSMLDWRGDGFTQLKDFWDRNKLATSGRTALNADSIGGSSTLGLAEFTSGNFIGQRAVYAEFVPTSDIHHFAFPSLADTTQPNLQPGNLWGTATHGNVTLQNFHQGTRLYISKTNAGVQVTYHSALSYLVAQHPDKSPGLPILTIADDNVLSNYHNIFIPKAVQYSAGLLDYFFRGTIATSFPQPVTEGTHSQYTFETTNISGQNFSGGAFYVLSEDSNGLRTIVQTNLVSGILTNGSSTTLAYPSTDTNKILAIYKGTIGVTNGTNALDPVDGDISIAAKYVEMPCNCAGASTNLAALTWVSDNPDTNTSVSGASGTMVNVESTSDSADPGYYVLSTAFCNPTGSDVTIHCAVVLNGWYSTEGGVSFIAVTEITGITYACSINRDFDFIVPANSVSDIDIFYPNDEDHPAGTGSMSFTLSIP